MFRVSEFLVSVFRVSVFRVSVQLVLLFITSRPGNHSFGELLFSPVFLHPQAQHNSLPPWAGGWATRVEQPAHSPSSGVARPQPPTAPPWGSVILEFLTEHAVCTCAGIAPEIVRLHVISDRTEARQPQNFDKLFCVKHRSVIKCRQTFWEAILVHTVLGHKM